MAQLGPGGTPPVPDPQTPKQRPWLRIGIMAALVALYLAFLALQSPLGRSVAGPARESIPYSQLKAQAATGNVKDLTVQGQDAWGDFNTAVSYGGAPANTQFSTTIPQEGLDQALKDALDQSHATLDYKQDTGGLGTLLINFLPFLLLIGFWIWILRRSGQATQGIFSFGRSRARLQAPGSPKTTFHDVAGVEQAQFELQEIVDFLRDPQRFQRLGGKMPKGVLLIGPPGTGKTLLARAVAGEAGVPFFSISASEFVEMFVGVGASRVRNLFEEAKKHSPAVIFVDELDAVGRQRGAGLGGGHDEREQTLNQLLVEMDGFDQREAVVVLAASNRADVLDPALLRPGRFDRRVVVDRPDRRGRLAILKIHTRGVPLDPDCDLDVIARSTPGLVGADLANLVNEAALHASRTNRVTVTMQDFEDSFDRVVLGAERKIMLSEGERRVISFHECGHALVAWYQPQSDPVHKITIVPRGQALGVTQSIPTDDRHNLSEEYLKSRIAMALGGRAAEQIALGSITTGAQNDLETATAMARRMVISWGMSPKLGLFSFDDSPDAVFLGRELTGNPHISQRTAALIDEEVTRLLQEGYETAERILTQNRVKLELLAEALLREEVLEEDQIARIIGPRALEGGATDRPFRKSVVADGSQQR
ncbi:MAG TPA: ATP-dependent zinc metalloprotease FtsH [Candidatus Limnocylindrales bacterium]|nr:ATP-dependent zinc metalloprotease FtsH [Candidatus Limnocylindrales bacterium]